ISSVIQATLNLIRNREPEEVDMTTFPETVIPTLLLNFSRLRTLKLVGFRLLEDHPHTIINHQYRMINLRELYLLSVHINNRVLNSMIAGAPLLEKLTLKFINPIIKHGFLEVRPRVEVCNHANLKHFHISSMMGLSEIVVGALHSLESLSLIMLDCHDLEIICSSELPSLKSLEIEYCYDLKEHAVNKLISKSPSLLSLRLVRLDKVNELKIESPTLEKLELMWYDWDPERVFRIDAPRLVNVRFGGNITFLHAISDATNSFQAAQIRSCTFELSLYCSLIANQIIMKPKEFLKKVTRQFQFVELKLHNITSLSRSKEWDQAEGSSPTPVVERVEVKLERESVNHNFLDSAVLEAAKDLIRNREPEEINMSIREGLIIPKLLLNYSRLRTLKLLGCTLLEDQYKMINLRVLHLFSARIDDPVLNSMIASAPLLEELNLMFVCYVKKVEFCNNANLKHLKISNMERLSEIVLVGAQQSLETLSLSMLDCHDLQIICSSLLPSLKSLEIRHFLNLRDLHAIHMLISKSPSLLSLRLVRLNKVNELKIESPTLEKLELVWYDRDPERVMFYIDAPRLVNVYFYGNIGSLHKMSHATNSFQAAQIRSSTIELSLVFKDMEYRKFKELKEFLRKVTGQFQCVELQLDEFNSFYFKYKAMGTI
ncbi:hypothetical protein LINPERPRIM_LOCUS12499, partial [Linum perenne]